MLKTAKIKSPIKDEEGKTTGWEEVNAFEHTYLSHQNRRYGALKCHDQVYNHIVGNTDDVANLNLGDRADPKFLPMVIPPRPWKGVDDGGYLHLPTKVMRTRGEREQLEAFRNAGPMPELFEGLNALGNVPLLMKNDDLESLVRKGCSKANTTCVALPGILDISLSQCRIRSVLYSAAPPLLLALVVYEYTSKSVHFDSYPLHTV